MLLLSSRGLRNALRRFARNERGSVIVLFAMSLVAMVGMVALSSDLGRQMRMDSELQEMADAAALAAAKELDTKAGSFQRAIDEVAKLNNNSIFAENGVQVAQLIFAAEYDELVTSPIETITLPGGIPTALAADQARASWVQAVTTQGSATTFFAGVVGGPQQMRARGRATAGIGFVACAIQPMFICNPDESTNFAPARGELFLFKAKEPATGGGGNYFYPGDFGLLDPPGLNSSGANLIKENLASESPPLCYINSLSVRTGQAAGPVDDGINVRFDMFGGSSPNHPPAPNVIKGKLPKNNNSCPNNYDPGVPVPKDSCFYSGTCAAYGPMRKGTADWGTTPEATAYWNEHHDGRLPTDFVNASGKHYGQPGYTRFDLYLNELGITDVTQTPNPPPLPTGATPSAEDPAPTCKPAGSPSRRIIYTAVINCAEYGVTGNSQPPMSSVSMAKWFVTHPASGGEVWVEFIEMLTPASDNDKLKAIVQLYPNPQD